MNHDLANALLALRQRDLDTRTRLLNEGRLYEGYDPAMQQVHTENAEALAGIVDADGWPGVSRVGLEACRAAWLVAQHAICTPALQRRFREALAEAVAAGDAPARQLAVLTDRIRFHEGRPQVYGTVLDWGDDGQLGCELEDPEGVDLRRASVGLPPFEVALAEHRREVAAEGGRPPADRAARARDAEAWARRVGWREAPDP
ncbi:MAG: hypothetical protein KDH20_17820 [Rhodocyclaceae bacterium]|nr:hypothetical protein [Rhodocyclaceae bacterium]